MARIELPHPIAFVLGGGGSLGAAQVGMLQALSELGVFADIVVGTSIGSLNGAVLAEDPSAGANRLSHLWEQTSRDDVFPGGLFAQLRTLERSRTYLFDNKGLRATAERFLRVRDIDELAVPYAAIATDVDRGEVVLLRRGSLVDAVLASAAIPGVFPSVTIGERTLCDGGVVANVAIVQTLELGPASMVVLDCIGLVPSRRESLPEVLLNAFSISCHYQPAVDAPFAAQQVPLLYLPTPTITGSMLDFGLTPALVENGYELAKSFLEGVEIPDAEPRLYHPELPPDPAPMTSVREMRRAQHWPWRRREQTRDEGTTAGSS